MHRNKRDDWITIKFWIIRTLSRFILGYLFTRQLFLKKLELSKKEIKKSMTKDENTSMCEDWIKKS